jgi:hypothetical protein
MKNKNFDIRILSNNVSCFYLDSLCKIVFFLKLYCILGGWYVVYDKVRHTYCNVDDLILGNDYQFRIRAINEVGLGEGAATKEFATIAKESVTYQKPEYPEMVFNVKPEFTTSLNNRKLMVGYSGKYWQI